MRALRRFNDQRGYPLWLIGGRRSTFDICGDGRSHYGRPFICAMTLPQLVSESSVIASLLAIFSMHSGQANSSLRGARRSAPCEMTAPISLPHCLHRMFNGTNTAYPPFYEMHRSLSANKKFASTRYRIQNRLPRHDEVMRRPSKSGIIIRCNYCQTKVTWDLPAIGGHSPGG